THYTERPRGTSYETIWAADRKVLSMLYLLCDDQPAMMMPITSSEIMASRKNKPEATDAPAHVGLSGRKAKPAKTAVKIISGAIRNSTGSALAGTMSSLIRSLTRLATDCATPYLPVSMGPSRSWMKADTFRSP